MLVDGVPYTRKALFEHSIRWCIAPSGKHQDDLDMLGICGPVALPMFGKDGWLLRDAFCRWTTTRKGKIPTSRSSTRQRSVRGAGFNVDAVAGMISTVTCGHG